jgi:regulation of enolase protein 1 (concanavalin A-like superfamily)
MKRGTDLEAFEVEGGENGTVTINGEIVEFSVNARTDWFFSPASGSRISNVVRFTRRVTEKVFSFAAEVSVDFASPFDGGALFVECSDESWAKIAFELSAERKPTIVSVVTRGTSDDSDGPNYSANSVWIRLYCDGKTAAFHFSEDGKYWRFLRWFTIPGIANRPIKIGLGIQSPTGEGVKVKMRNVQLKFENIEDLRSGE